MRIIYLYSSLAIWGGIERVLVDKMNQLVRLYGYHIFMLTSDQGHHAVTYQLDKQVCLQDLQINFFTQYNYGGWRRLKERRRLSRLYHQRLKEKLRIINPDIIVCTTSQDVHGLLGIKGNSLLVVESHVNFSHLDTWWHCIQNRINNYWIGKAEAVVTLTEGDAKNWRRVNRNVHVIPNVVHLNDTGRYSTCANKRAIFVGRLVEQKGLSDLIKVWQIINQRYPDWQLDIFGEGQMDSIPDINLIVHPPTPNIMDEYIKSSMLLVTSVYEPFGLVIPEAMSCGLPVIAFDCPYGPAEIITQGKDGFYINDRDICAMANRVGQLIEDQDLRQEMGRSAIKSAHNYSADHIIPMWKALFESIIKK